MTQSNRKWWIACAVGMTSGLVLLDETIVGVALPDIGRDLSMSTAQTHWIVSAYLLAFAGLAGAGGRFADLWGIRRVYIAGTLLLAVASLLAGLAPSGGWLIAARVLQGVAAAFIFPVGFAMVTTTFPQSERGTALGILASTGTVMLAFGPFLGGVLTSLVSWQFIFFINVPLVLLGLACVAILVPRADAKAAAPMDPIGLVTLLGGLVLLVLGVMQGPQWGWSNPIVPACVLGGLALLALFAVQELRVSSPVIDVRLFAYPTVVAAALVFFTGQFTKIVVVVFVPLFLQHTMGFSPVIAGMLMIAGVFGMPLLSVPSGRVADRIGARIPALVGLAGTTIGTVLIGVAAASEHAVFLVCALLFWGTALPANFLPASTAVMKAVPHERQGEAAGVTVTSRLVGGVVGMSGASAIYASTGRYDVVFYASGALMFVVLVLAFFMMERDAPAEAASSR